MAACEHRRALRLLRIVVDTCSNFCGSIDCRCACGVVVGESWGEREYWHSPVKMSVRATLATQPADHEPSGGDADLPKE